MDTSSVNLPQVNLATLVTHLFKKFCILSTSLSEDGLRWGKKYISLAPAIFARPPDLDLERHCLGQDQGSGAGWVSRLIWCLQPGKLSFVLQTQT